MIIVVHVVNIRVHDKNANIFNESFTGGHLHIFGTSKCQFSFFGWTMPLKKWKEFYMMVVCDSADGYVNNAETVTAGNRDK